MLRFARAAKPCPGCGDTKVLAFYDEQHRPACARCTGNPPVYACRACGREDIPVGHPVRALRAGRTATALLSQPGGGIHPRLQPVYDALLAGPRPQTTLYWFDRSTGPDLLRSMARGEVEISHATFEADPTNKTNTYLRDLLAALGVLPPFHAELERVTPWLADILAALPAEHADVVARFARWQVLRRLALPGTARHPHPRRHQRRPRHHRGHRRFLAWLEPGADTPSPRPPRPTWTATPGTPPASAGADPVPGLGPHTAPSPPD